MATTPFPGAATAGGRYPVPASARLVEVTVPVFNEESQLAASIRRLTGFLETALPVRWHVTVADNASTDGTWAVACALAAGIPGVAALHLDVKGRGHALRAAWERSGADVLAYMDVDLSTNLESFPPLIAALLSGHSEVAIGSRLARRSRVRRRWRREVLSRGYNALLQAVLGVRFSDAQCGFKAVRADAARRLLPEVADGSWFFDTELLFRAERAGMRIFEVPVDWVEDLDSRVDIPRTVAEDLRGIARLRGERRRGRVPDRIPLEVHLDG